MDLNFNFFVKGITFSLLAISSLTIQAQKNIHLEDVTVTSYSAATKLPNVIKFKPEQRITEESFVSWFNKALDVPDQIKIKSYEVKNDNLGFTHTRYKEYVNNYPIEGSMIITHSKNGTLNSVNGDYFLDVPTTNLTATLSEKNALQKALKKIKATKYMWEDKASEEAAKATLKQPNYTYYPKGELVIVHKSGADYSAFNMRLAYKFDIYAQKPLYRAYVFVDAKTGEVIAEKKIIHTADAVGVGNTKYSGSVPMTCDNFGSGQYRLRETGRGNGIQTYNLNNSTSYTNTDFTSSSSTFNLSGNDKACTDAHWGAEKTYDYYMQVHNRNSIDGSGFALLNYVHYDVNYVNAFWDGQRMTYGDGDLSQGYDIMTALDICGHEVTHGLTSYTAALGGSGTDECDALNEGFSDVFGTSIEFFARPSQHDWLMGSDNMPSHTGLRDMSNPSSLGQPNCYLGTNWDQAGEPHNNNGPCIYWYYLLCQGGSGTNDIGNAYTVTGITMAKAEKIAFRGLTNYMTSGSDYNDARTQTIQAALDLYGNCSPEVIATTNAWYAVGVGAAYAGSGANAAFSTNGTTSCSTPFNVYFLNNSLAGSTSTWNFGDGATSTAFSPTHTYTTAGTYNVKLTISGSCGSDSVVQNSYITVSPAIAPTGFDGLSCATPSTVTLSATGSGTLGWYSVATGGPLLGSGTSFTTPSISNTTTYYVESQAPGATTNVGPTTTTIFGGGGYHNNSSTQYLIFEVLQSCTIQTALVNSGAAGSRNIIVWDTLGTVLQTIPVTFPNGIGIVTLNIHLNPGAYRIGGSAMNLWRNNTGGTYPFILNDVLKITGSSAGSTFYYYLYNWQVQADFCSSARTPVVAHIGGASVSYNNAPYDTVSISSAPVVLTGGVPSGGIYSGTGVTGGSFTPSVAGLGNFTITYSFDDPNGCNGQATQNIYVYSDAAPAGINSTSIVSSFLLFPNPSNGNFTLDLSLFKEEKIQVEILNSIGQIVFNENYNLQSGANKVTLQLDNPAHGVYFMKVKSPTDMLTKRFVVE
jgi:Zn-dependent metalloprotease